MPRGKGTEAQRHEWAAHQQPPLLTTLGAADILGHARTSGVRALVETHGFERIQHLELWGPVNFYRRADIEQLATRDKGRQTKAKPVTGLAATHKLKSWTPGEMKAQWHYPRGQNVLTDICSRCPSLFYLGLEDATALLVDLISPEMGAATARKRQDRSVFITEMRKLKCNSATRDKLERVIAVYYPAGRNFCRLPPDILVQVLLELVTTK